MVPSEPWRNSTPFFGAAAFCATKNDDFREQLGDRSGFTFVRGGGGGCLHFGVIYQTFFEPTFIFVLGGGSFPFLDLLSFSGFALKKRSFPTKATQ